LLALEPGTLMTRSAGRRQVKARDGSTGVRVPTGHSTEWRTGTVGRATVDPVAIRDDRGRAGQSCNWRPAPLLPWSKTVEPKNPFADDPRWLAGRKRQRATVRTGKLARLIKQSPPLREHEIKHLIDLLTEHARLKDPT
jgi:hypothetical protein